MTPSPERVLPATRAKVSRPVVRMFSMYQVSICLIIKKLRRVKRA